MIIKPQTKILLYYKLSSVLCMNIRSIYKHFDVFIVILITSCETWLENNSSNFGIDGYTNYNYYRKFNKSDKILVFIRNVLSVVSVNVWGYGRSLQLFISFNILNDNCNLNITSCMYRSPSLVQNLFINSVEKYLSSLPKKDSHITCSDININLQLEHIDTVKYLNVLSSYGFKSCINNATR